MKKTKSFLSIHYVFVNIRKKMQAFLRKLGPGLITGVSDDDPSGIATYSQAGAQFGLGFLWTALLTYPLMYAIQEMCARIGIATSTGLTGILRRYYSKAIIYTQLILVIPALILNIAANISGMSAVAHLLYPSLPPLLYGFVFTAFILIFLIFFNYKKVALILKYACLSLLAYFLVPFFVEQDWYKVFFAALVPSFNWGKESISILVAILGTTISPYLFFWQATMSCEQCQHQQKKQKQTIDEMKMDVNIGMLLSNLAMFFIILTTASVLFKNGITDIQTVDQAAKALEPLAGEAAYIIFSVGILGVGFLSIPVLGACAGYIVSETFGLKQGLDCKFKEAKVFYIVIIFSLLLSLIINIIGIDPIKGLIFTAIVYGIITPFLVLLILHICNRKKIMGTKTNTWISNVLGIATLILTSSTAVLLLVITLLY